MKDINHGGHGDTAKGNSIFRRVAVVSI